MSIDKALNIALQKVSGLKYRLAIAFMARLLLIVSGLIMDKIRH